MTTNMAILPDAELRPEDLEDIEFISFNKVLRSSIRDFSRCQRKFWYRQREGFDKAFEKNKSTLELFKELVSIKVQKMALPKEERKGSKLMSSAEVAQKLKDYDVSIQKNARRLARFFGVRKFFGKRDTLIGTNVWVETALPNNMLAKGKLDIVILKDDVFMGEYVNIVIPTLTFGFSEEGDDPESIFLAYLAFKKFGKPVAVTKVSPNTPDTVTDWYMPKDEIEESDDTVFAVEDLEEIILGVTKKMKDVAEDSEIPFPYAASHCHHCPFLDKCFKMTVDKEKVESFSPDELKATITLSQEMAKKARKLLISHFKESGADELPLYDGSSVHLSQSISYNPVSEEIKGRVTKDKLLNELDGDDLEQLKSVGALSLASFSNENARKQVKKIMKQKGIALEFTTSTKTSVSISEPPTPKTQEEKGES